MSDAPDPNFRCSLFSLMFLRSAYKYPLESTCSLQRFLELDARCFVVPRFQYSRHDRKRFIGMPKSDWLMMVLPSLFLLYLTDKDN